MDTLFDKYAWQAWRTPALIVSLPLVLCFIAWVPNVQSSVQPVLGAAAGAGVLILLMQLVRDAGKSAEKKLIAQWGALPSTSILRHRDPRIDSETKKRYHTKLQQMIPGLVLPTPSEETANPSGADRVYESCGTFLRSQTRQDDKFTLLHIENMAYGFRRNLFGLRPFGIVLSFAGLGGCARKLIFDLRYGTSTSILSVACSVGCLALVVAWLFVINKRWVRQAADDYAVRLVEAIDRLESPASS